MSAADTLVRGGGAERTKVPALARGLRILGLFDAAHRELTLHQIVHSTGLPRMTA